MVGRVSYPASCCSKLFAVLPKRRRSESFVRLEERDGQAVRRPANDLRVESFNELKISF